MKNKIYYSALILLNIVIIFSVYIVIENNQNKANKIAQTLDSLNENRKILEYNDWL